MATRRESIWKIVWAPGAGARTLLASSNLMEREIATYEAGAHQAGTLDGAASARLVARGGARRTLEFSRVRTHDTFLLAWQRLAMEMALDPWGVTSTLQVTPAGQAVREVRAALLRSSHRISTETGSIETIHTYQFRISRDIL
jgi:hypothetical protein